MPCVVLRSCLLNKNVRRSWMTAISLVLCVHTSAMCSLPGREAGATFPAGGGAASRAPGSPVTKPCSGFNFFCPHPSTSKMQCSDNCFLGRKRYFESRCLCHVDGPSCTCGTRQSHAGLSDRDVSLTEMQRHNFKRLRLQLNMLNSDFTECNLIFLW